MSQLFSLTSPGFHSGQPVPARFTCDGANRSPALVWQGAPTGGRGFALVMHDPDAPGGDFTHWLLWDIPSTVHALAEGAPLPGVSGRNGFGRIWYGGPCPPPGRAHRYFFQLHALRTARLPLRPGATRAALEAALRGQVLATATLLGTYARR